MAISTKSLQSIYNIIAAQGIPDPRNLPSGFGDDLGLDLASRVMADLISERFNQKFNRAIASPIYTNSYQQDYPQPAQAGGPIGWGEDCDICDINNTVYPKPLNWDGPIKWVRNLTRTSISRSRPFKICWMYNAELAWGTWPGAGTHYYPLVTTGQVSQNPLMNFIDKNGNYLILTGFGVTGGSAPFAAASAAEGVTVSDGSCTWAVVSGTSQGFRIDYLPGVGPTYQIVPCYQLDPPTFTAYAQLLNPIPDSFSRHFQTGLEWQCKMSSVDPQQKAEGQKNYPLWLNAMEAMIKQGNREPDSYGMVPASPVAEPRWGWRGPRTADSPY